MIRLFPLIFLVILSCSDDRRIAPDKPVMPGLTGLLKTVTIRSSAGETKEEYSYTDSLTLKSIRFTRNGQSTMETFEYEKDFLIRSLVGDTLKKYIYQNGRLRSMEKHVNGKPDSYTVVIFNHDSDAKVNTVQERVISTQEPSGTIVRELLLVWRGENIGTFRERFHDGSAEDYDFQYGESRNPYNRLYTETLRIPAENPYFLSYSTPLGYSAFFAGKKYRVEGTYLASKLPVSESIFTFDIQNGGEWKLVKQYTFEYFE